MDASKPSTAQLAAGELLGSSCVPSAADVREQLERIVRSATFVQSDRMCRFLLYTVEQTLQGCRAEELKEYSIGVNVFDRPHLYDPRLDPIVRVEARRLRGKLKAYYASEGALDAVWIDYPKGSYAPALELRKATVDRPPAKPLGRVIWWYGCFAILLLAAVAFVARFGRAPSNSAGASLTPSLAVRPFQDMSRAQNEEYLCDGITENLISALAGVKGLRVVARTSSFAFKGKDQDAREMGRRLGVAAVLEGTLRREGDRLHITAQLIDAASGNRLWSHIYDADMISIFAVQGEIAGAARRILLADTAGQTSGQPPRPTSDLEAYGLYLQGRFHWNKNTRQQMELGAQYFEKAIARDPRFSAAYAGLADFYIQTAFRELSSPAEAYPRARSAALRALDLDERSPESHNSLARIKMDFDWDWAGAGAEFDRAVELAPGYATAHHWRSHYLIAVGRVEESLAASKRALELDPLDPTINAHLGWHYLLAGEYDRAIEQCRKVTEMNPEFAMGHLFLGEAYSQKGLYAQATSELQKAIKLSQVGSQMVAALGYTYARSGRSREAREVLERLDMISAEAYVSPFSRAVIYAALADRDRAFFWLEKAREEHSSWLAYSRVDPRLTPLRSDPRFQTLLDKVFAP